MKITVMVLSADLDRPAETRHCQPDDLSFFQEAVGGNIEPVDLCQPRATLYANEDGIGLGLPMNVRATLLAGAANPAWRGGTILGDTVVTGPPRGGWDTSIPDEYTAVLAADSGPFRVEFQSPSGGRRWPLPGRAWPDVFAAYTGGLNISIEFPDLAVRVVPTSASLLPVKEN